jgi:branched-chain amino acid transport system permease protein
MDYLAKLFSKRGPDQMINLRDAGANFWEKLNRVQRTIFVLVVIAFFLILPYMDTFGPTSFVNTPIASFRDVLIYPIGMFVLMGLGLNIVVGKSGLLDLGYVAFFAIGAYTSAILSTTTSLNVWEILPIGIGLAMLSGFLLGLPTLRLRGDYLAIVTLGFGEITRIVVLNSDFTGGTNGIPNIPPPPKIGPVVFDIMNPQNYYYVTVVMILLTIWMIRRLSIRRPGRAWEAIRQDEDVAMLMGVPTLKYKLWSFTMGAAVGGAAGVIFASKAMVITPGMFDFQVSILVLACVVFGGLGNIWGVVLGGIALAYIPERIRFLTETRQLAFGLVLVIMMNFRPDGMLPRKKREKISEKKKEIK